VADEAEVLQELGAGAELVCEVEGFGVVVGDYGSGVWGHVEGGVDADDVVVDVWLVGEVVAVVPPYPVGVVGVDRQLEAGFGDVGCSLSSSARASMMSLMRASRMVSHSVRLIVPMVVSYGGAGCMGWSSASAASVCSSERKPGSLVATTRTNGAIIPSSVMARTHRV